MAKSQETWSKKEREKKKQKNKKDKEEKKQERKDNNKDGKSFDDMIAYIDENTHTAGALVDHCNIRFLVAIDISHCYCVWTRTGRVILLRKKGKIAFVQ